MVERSSTPRGAASPRGESLSPQSSGGGETEDEVRRVQGMQRQVSRCTGRSAPDICIIAVFGWQIASASDVAEGGLE